MTKSQDDGVPTDDEATAHDLEVPGYDHAPPTLEMRPSPFHHLAPQILGVPKITSMTPTTPGPQIVIGSSEIVDPMAGPTDPDGHPISGSFEHGTDPNYPDAPWIDPGQTVPGGPMPMPPSVPAPDAPNILVSQSLIMEAAFAPQEQTPTKKSKRPKAHYAPTEVALPAIKRKKAMEKGEGSDWPLIFGLIGLGLLIAVVVAAISYFLVRSWSAAPVHDDARYAVTRVIRATPGSP